MEGLSDFFGSSIWLPIEGNRYTYRLGKGELTSENEIQGAHPMKFAYHEGVIAATDEMGQIHITADTKAVRATLDKLGLMVDPNLSVPFSCGETPADEDTETRWNRILEKGRNTLRLEVFAEHRESFRTQARRVGLNLKKSSEVPSILIDGETFIPSSPSSISSDPYTVPVCSDGKKMAPERKDEVRLCQEHLRGITFVSANGEMRMAPNTERIVGLMREAKFQSGFLFNPFVSERTFANPAKEMEWLLLNAKENERSSKAA